MYTPVLAEIVAAKKRNASLGEIADIVSTCIPDPTVAYRIIGMVVDQADELYNLVKAKYKAVGDFSLNNPFLDSVEDIDN